MADKIKVLFIGDIVGGDALDFFLLELPNLKAEFSPDFIIVNGENAAAGKGIVESEANRLFEAGVNVITTGNHIWDNWKSKPLLAQNDSVIRPYNYPPGNVGRGFKIAETASGVKIGVLQLQGRTFMQAIDCPFRGAETALRLMKEKTNLIIVDFHADATAEKYAMARHLDGKVSALLGTHTHIQTADAQILSEGTGFISDVGMTGPYDSVVGLRNDIALKRFMTQVAHKYELGSGDLKVCGVALELDAETGQCMRIQSFTKPDFPRSIADLMEME
ncbi:MAG: TIGR00282 family metallophosphoesterase [Chloroflexota bacterium]